MYDLKIEVVKEVEIIRKSLLQLPEKTSGQCFAASNYIADNLKHRFPDCKFLIQHGELAHAIEIPSKYWRMQHTWLKIIKNDTVLYVDATCDQFKDVTHFPEYYISEYKHRLFLYDEDNIIYKYSIDNKLLIRTLEFLEYTVKGCIYDFIRKCISVF